MWLSPSLPMRLRGDLRVALQGSGAWQPHPACCWASLKSEGFWLEACPDCTLTRLWNFLVFLLHLRIWKDSCWARQVALRIAQSLDQCWSQIWSASRLLPGFLGWQRPSLLKSEAQLLGQGSFEEHLWYCSFVRDQSLGLGLEVDAFLRLLLAFWSDLGQNWPRSEFRLGQVSEEHDAIQKRFQERGVDAGFWRCALAVIPEPPNKKRPVRSCFWALAVLRKRKTGPAQEKEWLKIMLSLLGRALARNEPSLPCPDEPGSPVSAQESSISVFEELDCSFPEEPPSANRAKSAESLEVRSFDMKLVRLKCLEQLVDALKETDAVIFGGAACYWAQKQELRRRLEKWLGWDNVTLQEFQDPRVDPKNYQSRTSLELPRDLDLWFLSWDTWEETRHWLSQTLPATLKTDEAAGVPVMYSSSPFPAALLWRQKCFVQFDVFASLGAWPPWPAELVAPVTFKLDCIFPREENLPLFVCWPWQLAPFPNKAKCLGWRRGEVIYGDTSTEICDLIGRVSTSWQPFQREGSQEAALWKLWKEQPNQGGLVAQEMSARRGVESYVERLLKELSEGWFLKDSPLLLRVGDDGQVFVLLVRRKQEEQLLSRLRETLRRWTEDPQAQPQAFSTKTEQILWRFPWDPEGSLLVDLVGS